MKKFFVSLGIAALLMGFVSAQAQDYVIKLNHPLKANQRYQQQTSYTDTTRQTLSVEGNVVRTQTNVTSGELESTVTVLEVDAIGRPTREAHQIIRCVLNKDGLPEVLLGAGTKVIAFRRGDKEVFEIQNKPVDAKLSSVLSPLISTTGGGPSDDEIFGTTERKKVGDTWRINEELALKDLKKKSSKTYGSLEKLTGTVTLEKVTKEGNMNILHLTSTVELFGVKPPLPESMTVESATMRMDFAGQFPEEGFSTSAFIEESRTATASFKASGQPNPDRPPVELTGTAIRSNTNKLKLLK